MRHRPKWWGVSLLVAALMIFSALSLATGLGVSASPTAPSTPATVHATAAIAVSSPATTPGGISGATPAGEATANPIALGHSLENYPLLLKAANEKALGSSAPTDGFTTPTETSPAANVPAPPPASPTTNYGYIQGRVVSGSSPHGPLSGAVVAAEPVTGFCPSVGCNPVSTSSNGSFKVAAAVGENEVYISDSYFMTNRTWTYVTPGSVINVGTLYLVADGYVTGVLKSDDPGQEPLGAVNITAITRDGTFVASPYAHSDSSGTFLVAVPPVPSQVTFAPIYPQSPYSVNNTWVNVTSGTTLNIGTVYLEKATPVSIEIVNSITGAPIRGTYVAMQVCSKATGVCDNPGATYSGPSVVAPAPIGPDSVTVEAAGFVNNQTSLGFVPATSVGVSAVSMGTVDMVPIGGISLNVGLMGNPPTNTWNVGLVTISACSLDNIYTSSYDPLTGNMTTSTCTGTCASVGSGATFAGIPLRNEIAISPDTAGTCTGFPTWPIPPDLPAFPNTGWTNVTPNLITNAGTLDLLPGDYIEGQVLPKDATGWTASACSTDEPNLCGQTVTNDTGQDQGNNPAPGDCANSAPQDDYTFCIPAPPGPVKVVVVSTTAAQNYTWAEVPYLSWSQTPLPLTVATDPSTASIDLGSAVVSGRVLQAESLTPVIGLPGIEACSAGAVSSAAVCGAGVANPEGFFNVSAPVGWDQIRVSAPQYISNSTWVYVTRSNSTGTILLTPYGYIAGQVTDPEGSGIFEATVASCPVTDPSTCTPIGADGTTSTDGRYYGAVPAGGLPRGTYEVEAQAPGYTSDWTWVNVSTPGENFTVPNIVLTPLQPVGGNGTPAALRGTPDAARPSASAPLAIGAWVAGRVIDAQDGIGLTTASITAIPSNGGLSTILSTIRGTGGEFNSSLALGTYTLDIAQPGFYSASTFINVTGATDTVYIGLVSLTPFPTVTGRLVIDPNPSWRYGVTYGMGLGPVGTSVQVCAEGGYPCGTGVDDSGGDFNISAPAGFYDLVLTASTGTGPGTYPGGYIDNRTTTNVTNATGGVGGILMGMSIFGTITGQVVHNVSNGVSGVAFDQISFDSTFPVDATGGMTLNATGGFTMFFPESRGLNITVGGLGAWVPESVGITVNGTSQGGNATYELNAGGIADLGDQFDLTHYGWIDMQVTNNATKQPVPYATLGVASVSTLWNAPNYMNAVGVANGAGYVNVTAPPSPPKMNDTVNLTAPDYQYHVFSVHVNSSSTTVVNASNSKLFSLLPWGWISGTVTDALTGAGLEGVSVTVTGGLLQNGKVGIITNGLGDFVSDAPIGISDALALTLPGFSSNTTHYNVSAGEWVDAPTVHLTGDGVVQGEVIEFPGGLPVSGASVTVCPKVQPNCPNTVSTNASGLFTLEAAPGLDAISVAATGYVTNAPAYVQVASEQWYWVGGIDLYEYAYVAGTALGLPGGEPLANANASLCAVTLSGVGAGPCFTTVQTTFDGGFYLSAPAGNYVLQVNSTFYNDSYLPVSLAPGITLPVGTIFVQEYGTATGVVDSATTDAAVTDATVDACQNWGAHVCNPPTLAGSDGRYAVSGPPGTYIVQANAPGYQTAYLTVHLTSGETTAVPAFLLVPTGSGSRFVVSGTVFSAGASPAPLGGAVVTATGGTSTYVAHNGTFSFPLYWGSYTLSASLAGYVTQTATIDVEGPLTGVDFSLPIETYLVTGTVSDGLTQATLENVNVSVVGGSASSITGAGGTFSIALPNGTHDLVATDEQDPGAYAPLPFVVTVTGGPVSRDVTLVPPTVMVIGVVANALTGQSISGATISFSGKTSGGVAWSATATSDANGRFTVPAYPGTYEVGASGAGYSAAEINLSVASNGGASLPISFALSPLSTPASSGPSSLGMWELIGAVVVVGVVVAAVLLWTRRVPARRAPASQTPRARPPVGGGE